MRRQQQQQHTQWTHIHTIRTVLGPTAWSSMMWPVVIITVTDGKRQSQACIALQCGVFGTTLCQCIVHSAIAGVNSWPHVWMRLALAGCKQIAVRRASGEQACILPPTFIWGLAAPLCHQQTDQAAAAVVVAACQPLHHPHSCAAPAAAGGGHGVGCGPPPYPQSRPGFANGSTRQLGYSPMHIGDCWPDYIDCLFAAPTPTVVVMTAGRPYCCPCL